MIEDPHADVASYALGILDRAGVERFEDHLVTCDECALQLEDLIPVSRLLAGVDREAVAAAHRSLEDRHLLVRMRGAVTTDRRRARWRQGAAVGVAAAVALAAVIGWTTTGPSTVQAGPSPAAVASATLGAAAAGGGPGATTTPPGTRYQNTDSSTGTTLEIYVDGQDWGSRLTITLSKITGPLTCTLIAVGRDGSISPAATWLVKADGYGTSAHKEPLTLTAASSMTVDNIARIEVRAVTPQGVGSTVVSVPVA